MASRCEAMRSPRERNHQPAMMDSTTLPRELRSQVELELQSGERIMWMEQPVPGIFASRANGLVLFGIPWTAFAIFWTVTATRTFTGGEFGNMGWLFALFGVPFILIGMRMLTGPCWERRRAARTAYVITDRRAMILEAGWRGGMNVRSFDPPALRVDLQRKQNPNGTGDVIFKQELRRTNKGRARTINIGFLAVRDVKGVEEMVRALAQRTTT